MSHYNPVYKQIWSRPNFLKLSPNAKLLCLYLLTNERTAKSGIYFIAINHMICDCNLSQEAIEEALKSLIDSGMIKYWPDQNLVYIHKFFKFSKGMIKNPQTLKNTIMRQKELCNNLEAWRLFDEEYANELEDINKSLMKRQLNKNNNNNKDKYTDSNTDNYENKVIDLEDIVNSAG